MKQLITILFCLFTLFAEAQVNTNDTNKYFKSYDYGFSYKRLQAREAFIMPTDTVINKLGAVSLNGVIYLGNGIKWTSIGGGIDTTNQFVKRLTRTPGKDSIIYFVGANRFAIKDSVGTSIDTTSLSNRINKKIDSLKRVSDSVYAWINGTKVFQFKDSAGGGTTLTLQQVTDAGATSTNLITVSGLNLGPVGNSLSFIKSGNDELTITNSTTGDNLLQVNNAIGGNLKFGGVTSNYVKINTSPGGNVELQAPETSGTIPMSVNGYTANSAGAITIPTGGVAVDTIFRTLGKDSIFYKKNNITYAIKDSVGTNPAPVGYYGAFQDTTIQTAAAINTPYSMKLGTTDLSNGVTVVSDGTNLTRIKFANAGVYNIQFSAQFDRTNSGTDVVDIWLRKNGNNVSATGGKIVLSGGSVASQLIASWNYVVNASSNDYYQLMWSTPDTHVRLLYESAQTSPFAHSLVPSVILTVTQQSGIMAGTGISPLDTANMLSNYARTNLVNTKLNISDTSTMLTNYARTNALASKLNATDTTSLSNRINNKQTNLDLLQLIGWGVKAEPYGCTYANVTSQVTLPSAVISFYPFNWNVSDSIRGIAFINRATTTLTSTNYNGVAIYSLSAGTLTRLTFTANNSTFWDGTANTWKTQAITPYYLPKGVYFLGYQTTGSAGIATIASGLTMQSAIIEPPSAINPNGIKTSCQVANNTSAPPTSVAMSTTTTTQRIPYFILY